MFTRIFTLTVCISLFLVFSASATIWRVDNNSGAIADFTSLQEAHDDGDVFSGDTLYVIGSGNNYGNLNITKQLYIMGPGYFLDENPETQARLVPAQMNELICNTNSEGTIITGMTIRGDIAINTNNITLKRNRFNCDYNRTGIVIGVGSTMITFLQNYLIDTNSYENLFHIGDNCQVIISNNYIRPNGIDDYAITSSTNSTLEVLHNVIWGKINISNSNFHNNIIREGDFEIDGTNSILHNICNAEQLPEAGNNIRNVDMNTVFVNQGSTDGWWQLRTNSPAIGAGIDGVDIGMYGGATAYKLSGIPEFPAIYYFTAPPGGTSEQGLPVHIKGKSHN